MSGYVKMIMNGDDGFIVMSTHTHAVTSTSAHESFVMATDRLCTAPSNLNKNLHLKRLKAHSLNA